MIKNNTFNVCYLREYMDPEHQGEFFYAYETVYRKQPVPPPLESQLISNQDQAQIIYSHVPNLCRFLGDRKFQNRHKFGKFSG